MKKIVTIAAVVAVVWAGGQARAEDRLGARRGEVAAKVKETFEQVKALRTAVSEFYQARDAGDEAAAMASAAKAQAIWAQLPERVRANIQQRHPGTAERIADLKAEFAADAEPTPSAATPVASVAKAPSAAPAASGATTRPGATVAGTSVREGAAVSSSGTLTNAAGQTVRTYEGTSVREGDTVTHQHTLTDAQGQVVRTNDSTITRVEPGLVTRDTHIETAKGTSIDVDVTHERSGNTVDTTKTATITGKDGETKTLSYEGTGTREGDTVTRDGTWSNDKGETVATVHGQAVKDRATVTRTTEVDNAKGQTVRTETLTSTKDGNTVTRQGQIETRRFTRDVQGQATRTGNAVTHTGGSVVTPKAPAKSTFKANYKDDHDIFGGRPAPKARGKAPAKRK